MLLQKYLFSSLTLYFFFICTAQCDWIFPDEDSEGPPSKKPDIADTTKNPEISTQPNRPTTPDSNGHLPPVAPTNVPNQPGIIGFSPCPCPFTLQYNPVCGSDGKTYHNLSVLNCHQTCGINVTFVKAGGCTSTRT